MSIKLLKNKTSVGAGNPNQSNVPFDRDITFQAVLVGAPTQVDIDIEGSIGGAPVEVLFSHDVTAEGNMFHLVGKRVTKIQANLKTLTGGSTPDVTLYMQAGDS